MNYKIDLLCSTGTALKFEKIVKGLAEQKPEMIKYAGAVMETYEGKAAAKITFYLFDLVSIVAISMKVGFDRGLLEVYFIEFYKKQYLTGEWININKIVQTS